MLSTGTGSHFAEFTGTPLPCPPLGERSPGLTCALLPRSLQPLRGCLRSPWVAAASAVGATALNSHFHGISKSGEDCKGLL